MQVTDLYISIILGLTCSFLAEEFFGVLVGGVVVPGYLALVFDQPLLLVAVYLISMLTYVVVEFVLPRFVILFGRRKFVSTLLIAMAFKLIFDLCYPMLPFATLAFRGIGVIVPGLLANAYSKQGIPITVASSFIVTLVVFGLMNIIYLMY
ncbi:MAG TPA: poly-gamma-glutamate biosynthesis protein PgsC [Clostridiales bacterium]|jgi:poly-gamma-glutamate biosynthesis protein PgsC/CapC|nr:poly-gamma-glutamate biosynthesis protein PgsC [Clostridiales bacterium]